MYKLRAIKYSFYDRMIVDLHDAFVNVDVNSDELSNEFYYADVKSYEDVNPRYNEKDVKALKESSSANQLHEFTKGLSELTQLVMKYDTKTLDVIPWIEKIETEPVQIEEHNTLEIDLWKEIIKTQPKENIMKAISDIYIIFEYKSDFKNLKSSTNEADRWDVYMRTFNDVKSDNLKKLARGDAKIKLMFAFFHIRRRLFTFHKLILKEFLENTNKFPFNEMRIKQFAPMFLKAYYIVRNAELAPKLFNLDKRKAEDDAVHLFPFYTATMGGNIQVNKIGLGVTHADVEIAQILSMFEKDNPGEKQDIYMMARFLFFVNHSKRNLERLENTNNWITKINETRCQDFIQKAEALQLSAPKIDKLVLETPNNKIHLPPIQPKIKLENNLFVEEMQSVLEKLKKGYDYRKGFEECINILSRFDQQLGDWIKAFNVLVNGKDLDENEVDLENVVNFLSQTVIPYINKMKETEMALSLFTIAINIVSVCLFPKENKTDANDFLLAEQSVLKELQEMHQERSGSFLNYPHFQTISYTKHITHINEYKKRFEKYAKFNLQIIQQYTNIQNGSEDDLLQIQNRITKQDKAKHNPDKYYYYFVSYIEDYWLVPAVCESEIFINRLHASLSGIIYWFIKSMMDFDDVYFSRMDLRGLLDDENNQMYTLSTVEESVKKIPFGNKERSLINAFFERLKKKTPKDISVSNTVLGKHLIMTTWLKFIE